jgi:uncharacterized protein
MPATLTRPARRLILAVALLGMVAGLLTAAPAAPAKAADVPDGWTYESHWFTSHDGIQMHAGVFLPADRASDEQHPVLMNIGPYTAPNGCAAGTSPTDPTANLTGIVDRNPELWAPMAEGRWAYVAVDARGFGGSEGCFEYYMPNEALDAKVAIEWAAQQPWSTGKVGMWGKSYDGAQQVLAMAHEEAPEGLAATVIQAPGLSAYTALWHNGVHYATGRYGTTSVYTAEDLTPPQNADTIGSPEYAQAAASPVTSIPGNPTCRTDAVVMMNTVADREDAFWQGKEAYLGAEGSDVPTFWQHGFFDANTKAEHLPIWESLTGPKKAWFGQWDHIRGHENGVGRKELFLAEAFRFLDLHVRGIDSGVDEHHVTVQSGNADQLWRIEEQWPPADAATWTLPLNAGTYTDKPGNTPTGTAPSDGIWSISPELPHDAHLAGEAIANLQLSSQVPWTHAVAHLYDIDETGRAALVTRGAMATGDSGAEEIALTLYPQDWVFEEGHRIALHVSASDDNWYSPGVSQTTVTVAGGGLDLPLLTFIRDEFIEGGPSKNQGSTTVSAATIAAAEVTTEMPPAQQPRPEPDPAE